MSTGSENHEKLLTLISRIENSGLRHMPVANLDLTIPQVGLLGFVAKNPGGHIQDLAEGLNLTPPTVSVAVRKLEESGWLRRESDEQDRRASCIFLTRRAVEMVKQLTKKRQDKISQLLDSLTKEEQQLLLRLLEKVIDQMEAPKYE